MESSGDPILDNLRMQLKKHGASGILGLARKFKIMDDDRVTHAPFIFSTPPPLSTLSLHPLHSLNINENQTAS